MKDRFLFLWLPTSIVTVCIFIYSPGHLMITDELSYYFQSLWWQDHTLAVSNSILGYVHSHIEGHYPPGTSFMLYLAQLISSDMIYWMGPLYWIASLYTMYVTTKAHNRSLWSLFPLFTFVPLVFIMRTTMSEMPSLLLVSVGVYCYTLRHRKKNVYMILAFVTGLSLAFRETNVLLLSPLMIHASKNFLWSTVFFSIGLFIRLIGYFHLIGDPYYIKEGYPFGIDYILDNIWIYATVTIVFLPFGWLWLRHIGRPYIIAILSFLTVHLCYGYQAYEASGVLNGFLLNGRFCIPALPIFITGLSQQIKLYSIFNNAYLKGVYLVGILLLQGYVHQKSYQRQSDYRAISLAIETLPPENILAVDLSYRTAMRRYVYPFIHDRNWVDIGTLYDTRTIKQLQTLVQPVTIITLESYGTTAKQDRMRYDLEIIDALYEQKIISPMDTICTGAHACLKLFTLTSSDY